VLVLVVVDQDVRGARVSVVVEVDHDVSVVVDAGRVNVDVLVVVDVSVVVETEIKGGGTEVVVETVVSVVVDVLTDVVTDTSVIVLVDVSGGGIDVVVLVVVLQEVRGVGPTAVSTGSVKIKVSVPTTCVLTVDVTTQEAHGGEVGGLLGTTISVG
jgi:hypothetical protein